jgi:hypothetical protein
MSEAGRPTSYTEEIGNKICERLSGGESLRSICLDAEMPDKATVFRWLLSDKEVYSQFRDQYALAREIQYQCMADDLLDIADSGSNDWMERNDPNNPGFAFNGEAVARSRLRVDTRKWFMSKVLPKFADKQEKEPVDNDKLYDALANLIDKLPN